MCQYGMRFTHYNVCTFFVDREKADYSTNMDVLGSKIVHTQ